MNYSRINTVIFATSQTPRLLCLFVHLTSKFCSYYNHQSSFYYIDLLYANVPFLQRFIEAISNAGSVHRQREETNVSVMNSIMRANESSYFSLQ